MIAKQARDMLWHHPNVIDPTLLEIEEKANTDDSDSHDIMALAVSYYPRLL